MECQPRHCATLISFQPTKEGVRGRVAIALVILFVAPFSIAAAAQGAGDCEQFADDGVTFSGQGAVPLRPSVVYDNNTSGGWPVVIRVCIDPLPQPPRVVPQPPPPLSFTAGYAFWTGPNEVGVSWQTNVLSTGRLAWGVDPGRFIGYTDIVAPDGIHGARITDAPRDRPLHITVQAVSASGEILQMELQGPSPQLAPAPPPGPPPNVPLAIVTAIAAATAVLAVRTVLSRRK